MFESLKLEQPAIETSLYTSKADATLVTIETLGPVSPTELMDLARANNLVEAL